MMMTTRNIDRLRHNVLTEVLTDEQFASLRGQFTEHRFGTGEITVPKPSLPFSIPAISSANWS